MWVLESVRVISLFRVVYLIDGEVISIFIMGFIRIFFLIWLDLFCFINKVKVDFFENKVFIEYKKLMVSCFFYN